MADAATTPDDAASVPASNVHPASCVGAGGVEGLTLALAVPVPLVLTLAVALSEIVAVPLADAPRVPEGVVVAAAELLPVGDAVTLVLAVGLPDSEGEEEGEGGAVVRPPMRTLSMRMVPAVGGKNGQ